MKNKIIRSVIFIVVCIVIYFVIYNYTSQINGINKNNKYESTSKYENYRNDFINKYIETLKNNSYETGFNMLSEDSKKIFNNDLKVYSEQILETTRIMNRMKNGISINFINEFNMKKYNLIEYKIVSNKYEYIKDNEVYYSDEYSIFKKFYLVEYSPNVFKIDIELY